MIYLPNNKISVLSKLKAITDEKINSESKTEICLEG